LDSKNNVLTVCAVGDKYIQQTLNNLYRFKKSNWDIHILTDQPDKFNGVTMYEHSNSIFSYFDKLIFSFKVMKKLKTGVVSLDADKLYLISDRFIEHAHQYEEFRYYSINRWAPYFDHLKENSNWSVVYNYFKYLDVDIANLRNFWEEVLYFPYNVFRNHQINVDLETLKPIFEYRSIIDGWSRPSLGEGEGIAIGFLLQKYQLKAEQFPCEVFPNNNPFNGKEKLI